MSNVYRHMTPEDEEAVLLLWSEVFTVSYDYEAQRLNSDPRRYDTTFVASDNAGTVLATAHYRLHQRREQHGLPRLVGELDPVATRPEAQRQGHATQLVARALAAMEGDGCDWSLLATSEAGRPLYTRFGYTAFPMRYRRGALNPACYEPCPYTARAVRPDEFDALWNEFERIYAGYNAQRSLSVVRDQAYWATFIAPRLQHRIADEQLQVFLAATDTTYQHPCGYLLAHFFDVAFLIIELAVDIRHRNAIASLANAVGDEARKRGLQYGEADLPHPEENNRAVSRLFGATLHLSDENTQIMARPISKAFTRARLERTFSEPGAFYAVLDHF